MKRTAPTGEAATFFIPLEGGFLIGFYEMFRIVRQVWIGFKSGVYQTFARCFDL